MASTRPPPPRPSAPGGSSSNSAAPNQTLYISNLNDKIHKPDLKIALYTLFSTYGVVLDVIALKTAKMRGQAHVAFRDIAGASTAMRGCQGMVIFGKEMKIQYARSKSDTIAKLDGTYRMPSLRSDNDSNLTTGGGSGAAGSGGAGFAPLPGQKGSDDAASGPGLNATADGAQGMKRRRDESESEQSDVEMEVEDDDD
ncbi:U2 snRNP complex subunit msl1 [Orbilia oligospora]|uniref:U2 snRNP complex subunit msl1 n=1 Tax=Orbilia oligospora TaxID=2813651 RepID=A0A7C8TUH0_ORBOL|nr:U2 snRNP complex subunit msl1 [Orbilia oligospora]KAF3181450.1 U2 snRNP complex subunit msl1 [Orbilia oligospora]KAF3249865.1 U2 snRNP complex subunit msl1 [Orbilia oligospora]KAF3259319.1 U2 snRNP complex subunit msl1 [Orbilia oligospora]KAF3292485.1 U2 snRNP complex subunit msl1 [Orbilia oligospora]